MYYRQFSFVFGFIVWLVATLVFRFWGTSFFLIENDFIIISLYLITVPALYFLITLFFNVFKITRVERLKSAVFMAIPGMIGDVLCMKFHSIVFPEFSTQQTTVLGSWILWAYVVVLLTGIYSSLSPQKSNNF